ncbi:MAG: hypothetical protein NDI75_11805 [Candidatus Didemnitutus sp.]|nr:hypothetical protein [Candidatus Didemnitutus sp.]
MLTLALLGLLVLAVFALSVLVRVNGQISASSAAQLQARQNTLTGLAVAIGELQRTAGPDEAVTAMAGVAGVASTSAASTRHWCGVWRNDGSFVTWLASGATSPTSVGTEAVSLVAAGSVGNSSSTSANVEKQHVVAGKIDIVIPSLVDPVVNVGRYAFVVIDEGTKFAAYAPVGNRAIPSVSPFIGSSMLSDQLKLKSAVEASNSTSALLSYEQLDHIGTQVTKAVLQDCFHYVTLTNRFLVGNEYRTGMINVNTTSTQVWRSMLETYNALPGATPITQVNARGQAIGNNFAAATVGKAINAPFTSTAGFETYLTTIFSASGSPNSQQVFNALAPLLTVRSDTFRVRAYGEATNPADPTQVEATAYCEAIVQRTPEMMPGAFGRRFVVIYFRWLGPDDI